MNIREYIQKHRLITDGAFGTYYELKYDGEREISERANIRYPERVLSIHREYLEAGARLIRTNTFAANTMFFAVMEDALAAVRAGYELAAQAALEFMERHPGEAVFVAADIGPIYDMDHQDYEGVLQEYREICDAFLACGAECFVLETQSDFTYVEPVCDYIRSRSDAFILVQFALDKSGYTRGGLSAARVVERAADIGSIDAYGFNCELDAAHMLDMLRRLSFPDDRFISALPNAGYPYTLRGKTIYSYNAAYYSEKMCGIAELGMDILGGCCGTTPEFIRLLAQQTRNLKRTSKRIGVRHRSDVEGRPSAFAEKIERGEKAFIVELDPPFDNDPAKVLRGAKELREIDVDLITLSDSPMARSRMDAGQLAVLLQREAGVEVMPHISCRDRNVIAMRGGFLGMQMNGIRHFLIVTGDPVSRADRERVTPVYDFNSIKCMQYVREMNQELFAAEPLVYGGALNYHGSNLEAIVERMRQKQAAGCGFFLTQPIYTQEDAKRIEEIRWRIDAKIMCGIMPLVSYRNAMFVRHEMPGIHVSDDIVSRYRQDMSREEAEDVAVEVSLEIAERLYDMADGFYFMTPFNRTGLIRRIITDIRRRH